MSGVGVGIASCGGGGGEDEGGGGGWLPDAVSSWTAVGAGVAAGVVTGEKVKPALGEVGVGVAGATGVRAGLATEVATEAVVTAGAGAGTECRVGEMSMIGAGAGASSWGAHSAAVAGAMTTAPNTKGIR